MYGFLFTVEYGEKTEVSSWSAEFARCGGEILRDAVVAGNFLQSWSETPTSTLWMTKQMGSDDIIR